MLNNMPGGGIFQEKNIDGHYKDGTYNGIDDARVVG